MAEFSLWLPSVVALEFVIDICRGLELLLQTVCTHQRRRAVHPVEILDFLGDLEIGGILVHFLPGQLCAEHTGQFFSRHGLEGVRVQQWRGFVVHIGTQVVPGLGHLVFVQIDFVGNLLVCHGSVLLCFWSLRGGFFQVTKNPSPQTLVVCWDRKTIHPAVPPGLTHP